MKGMTYSFIEANYVKVLLVHMTRDMTDFTSRTLLTCLRNLFSSFGFGFVFRTQSSLFEINVLGATTNTDLQTRFLFPPSFAVRFNTCLCRSQQSTRLFTLLNHKLRFTSHAAFFTSGRRSNRRKESTTNVAAKSTHEFLA